VKQEDHEDTEGYVRSLLSFLIAEINTALNSGLRGFGPFGPSPKPPPLRSGGIGNPRAVICHCLKCTLKRKEIK